jgi:hypothetical protein
LSHELPIESRSSTSKDLQTAKLPSYSIQQPYSTDRNTNLCYSFVSRSCACVPAPHRAAQFHGLFVSTIPTPLIAPPVFLRHAVSALSAIHLPPLCPAYHPSTAADPHGLSTSSPHPIVQASTSSVSLYTALSPDPLPGNPRAGLESNLSPLDFDVVDIFAESICPTPLLRQHIVHTKPSNLAREFLHVPVQGPFQNTSHRPTRQDNF